MCLYLDVNVLLHILRREKYRGLGWKPVKERLGRCGERLVTSSLLIDEVKKKYPHLLEDLFALLDELKVEVHPLSEKLWREAQDLDPGNLLDALHAAVAASVGCRFLVTKYIKDFLREPIHSYLSSRGVKVADVVILLAHC